LIEPNDTSSALNVIGHRMDLRLIHPPDKTRSSFHPRS
jgi:hypothetical protein